ncbi:MAG: hypothetical protein R3B48_14755 [Kofleriaceae bacterium]
METQRFMKVLVVHPVLALARQYAEALEALGFPAEGRDELLMGYEHEPISALVLWGSLHWWIDEEQALPPTVLVGGDALGLVRAAGATRCPEGATPAMIARSLRSLLRLSRHSRGRGTMPMRLIGAPCIVKVGRWMSLPRLNAFEDDQETTNRDLRPTAQ